VVRVPLADRTHRLRPTAINQVLREVRRVEAEGQSVVSLMRGQPDTPTPGHIIEAAVRSLRDGRTGYPDNQGELSLRRAVAEKLKREQGLVYDPDREILITDGATLGLAAALGALAERNGTVLVPDPVYDAYDAVISLWEGETARVSTKLVDGRFTLDRQGFENAWVSGRDIILLNTPWNPVGTVLSREELKSIMEFAERQYFDYPVISDEIYESLIYDGRTHVSPAAVLPTARGRTVIVNSLSKTYAMTGWRVGYCAGPEEIIQGMFLILQQSSRGPATFVQDAASCALTSNQECVRRMAAEYECRRNRVVDHLRGIPSVEPLVPEGGLFVMVDVRKLGRPSNEVRRFLLHEAGVVVLHGSAYGPGGEGTLRVSFAAGGETLERGLDRLRDGLIRLAEQAPAEKGRAPAEPLV
jgi:aspartate/methionine/tyrosine aminotransferase